MSNIIITPDELAKSARQFKKELLIMPVIGLKKSLDHMTLRTGIRYEQLVGEMTGSVEVGPYDEDRMNNADVKIVGRKLRTYLGSVWEQFSPNSVYQSIYGDSIVSGEGLKNVPIAKAVLAFLMKRISQSLNRNLWSAVRSDSGTQTKDLFNGFDTITATEITEGNISVAKGNLFEFAEEITSLNAVDALKTFYRAASDELQEADENSHLKLFMPKAIYNAYVDDYQSTVGSVPYNREFEKTYLEGTDGQVELVALANKKGSGYIHLAQKSNMLVGVDQSFGDGSMEKLDIEKHNPWKLDLVAAMFFGTEIQSISPEALLVGKLHTP